VMPYYNERDMVNFLSTQHPPLSEFQLCSLVLQLASALNFLHSSRPPRVHRDVKLDNILMFEKGERTLLVDLDLSRAVPNDPRTAVTQCGTYEYMAPEAERGEIGPPADVWALGIILFIMLAMPDFLLIPHPKTGEKLPFSSREWQQDTLWQAIRAQIEASARRRKVQYSQTLAQLACKMLNRDPRQRPTAAEVMETLNEVLVRSLTSLSTP
jgi:serine/threonine protein kinase